MRVSNSYNPYARIPNKATAKNSGFAELLTNQTRVSSDSFIRSPQASAQINKPVAAKTPAALTQEQIDDLKGRYDIENMGWPTDESAAFGDELFTLGVIDDEQRQFFHGAVRYTEDPFPLGILTPEGETQTRQLNYAAKPGDSMIDILLGELAVQQKNLDFMRSPDTAEKRKLLVDNGIPMKDHIRYLEDYTKQYQSAYDIMKRFV